MTHKYFVINFQASVASTNFSVKIYHKYICNISSMFSNNFRKKASPSPPSIYSYPRKITP